MKVSEWNSLSLGELGEFRNGINFSRDEKGGDDDTALRLINVKDLYTDTPFIDLVSLDRVSLRTSKNLDRYKVKVGDIFFARSSVKRDGVGVVSMAKKGDEGALHCGFIIRFRLLKEDIDHLFLSYLLRSSEYRMRIINLSSGAAITNISQDSLRSLIVELPPPSYQSRIAAILSAYDDLIENNLRRIKILEEMAQNLYREWFVKFRFPGHEQVSMVDSPLGKIPEGWEVVRLKEVADVNVSSIRKGNAPEEIIYVDIASVSPGSIDKMETMRFLDAPSRARRVVKHGDIIWSSVRPNRRSFSLILKPPPNLIVSTGFAVISPRQIPFAFLYQSISTDDFVSYLVNHAKGAAYPAVNADDFENASIVLPNSELLEKFDQVIQPMAFL